jgi:hypothetical protein
MKRPIVLTGPVTSIRVLASRLRSGRPMLGFSLQNSARRLGSFVAGMMPIYKPPSEEIGTNEGRITPATKVLHCSDAYATLDLPSESEIEHTPRQIDVSFPRLRLAAPLHGDFIPKVGRAYRMSANNGLKFAVVPKLTTSSEGTAP